MVRPPLSVPVPGAFAPASDIAARFYAFLAILKVCGAYKPSQNGVERCGLVLRLVLGHDWEKLILAHFSLLGGPKTAPGEGILGHKCCQNGPKVGPKHTHRHTQVVQGHL